MHVPARLTAPPTKSSLRRWNGWLAGLHALQAVAILSLGVSKTFPITISFLTVDTLRTKTTGGVALAPATHHLWDLNLAYLVAVFLLLSAVAHGLMATIYRRRYEAALDRGINHVRWGEYALSASTMLVAIAVLAGMYDAVSLGLVFALSAVMNLCGLVMELTNNGRGGVNWSSYVVGCLAGITPWLGIAGYLAASSLYGSAGVPGFVWGIFASIFVFFSCFAVNMWLQYRRLGPWQNYLYGERWYMILSLVAKSLLAWQVFAGVLQP